MHLRPGGSRSWATSPLTRTYSPRRPPTPSAEHAPTPAHPRTCTLHTVDINRPRLSSFGEKRSWKCDKIWLRCTQTHKSLWSRCCVSGFPPNRLSPLAAHPSPRAVHGELSKRAKAKIETVSLLGVKDCSWCSDRKGNIHNSARPCTDGKRRLHETAKHFYQMRERGAQRVRKHNVLLNQRLLS